HFREGARGAASFPVQPASVADEVLGERAVGTGQLRELDSVVVGARSLAGLPAVFQVDLHQLEKQGSAARALLVTEEGHDARSGALLPGGVEPIGDFIDPVGEGRRHGRLPTVATVGHGGTSLLTGRWGQRVLSSLPANRRTDRQGPCGGVTATA